MAEDGEDLFAVFFNDSPETSTRIEAVNILTHHTGSSVGDKYTFNYFNIVNMFNVSKFYLILF